jgi:hypothetical protein
VRIARPYQPNIIKSPRPGDVYIDKLDGVVEESKRWLYELGLNDTDIDELYEQVPAAAVAMGGVTTIGTAAMDLCIILLFATCVAYVASLAATRPCCVPPSSAAHRSDHPCSCTLHINIHRHVCPCESLSLPLSPSLPLSLPLSLSLSLSPSLPPPISLSPSLPPPISFSASLPCCHSLRCGGGDSYLCIEQRGTRQAPGYINARIFHKFIEPFNPQQSTAAGRKVKLSAEHKDLDMRIREPSRP